MYKGILVPHQHSITVGCKKCACITHNARSIMFCKDNEVCNSRKLKVEIEHIHSNSTFVKEKGGDKEESGKEKDSETKGEDSTTNSEKGEVDDQGKTFDTESKEKENSEESHTKTSDKETGNRKDVVHGKDAHEESTETEDKKSLDTDETTTDDESPKNHKSANNEKSAKDNTSAKDHESTRDDKSIKKDNSTKDDKSTKHNKSSIDHKSTKSEKSIKDDASTRDHKSIKDDKSNSTKNDKSAKDHKSTNDDKSTKNHKSTNDDKSTKNHNYKSTKDDTSARDHKSTKDDKSSSTKDDKSTKNNNSTKDNRSTNDHKSTNDDISRSTKDDKSTKDHNSTKDNKSTSDHKSTKDDISSSTKDDKSTKDHNSTKDDKSTKDHKSTKDDESTKDHKSIKDDKSTKDHKSAKNDKSSSTKDDKSTKNNNSTKDDKSTNDHKSTKDDKSTKDHKSTKDDKSTKDHKSIKDDKSTKDHKATKDDKSTKDHKSIKDDKSTKDHKSTKDVISSSTKDDKSTKDHNSTKDDESTKDHRFTKADQSIKDDESTKDDKSIKDKSENGKILDKKVDTGQKDRSSLVNNIVEKAKISMGKTKDKSPCQKSKSPSQPERLCYYKNKSYKNGELMKLQGCVSCVCTVAEMVEFKCTQDKQCLQKKITPHKTTEVHEEKCYFRNKAYSIGKGFYISQKKCTCNRLSSGLIFRCSSVAPKPDTNVIHGNEDDLVKTVEKKKCDDKTSGDHNNKHGHDGKEGEKHESTHVEEIYGNGNEEGDIENTTEHPNDYHGSKNEADEPDNAENDDEDEEIKKVIRDIVQKSAQDEIKDAKERKKHEVHSDVTKKAHDGAERKVTDDHRHTSTNNTSPTRIVFNIRRSAEGCYMGNHFVKYSQAIERPCSSCLCTKNPERVFFCKTRRHELCQTSKTKCLFENKTYDITDSINHGCNRCVCDSDQSFKPVIRCYKDPFCVEKGREFCWHNGRKIPLGLVFRHNKCKECACLLYQGSPSVQCKQDKSCSQSDHTKSNPTSTSAQKGSFFHHQHMTAIETKQCSVDGKIIPLLQGITVGNCKTCVCLNVGNNVGFYCKKTPGCVDVFSHHVAKHKTVEKKSWRTTENGSVNLSWGSSRHHCHLNDRRIPVGSRIRIEDCTVCRCLTDSQESCYLSCHYYPSCANRRSDFSRDESHHRSHTSLTHDHRTSEENHHHHDKKPKQHENDTKVISGCRRKGKVISFGAELKLSKCKVCTCKQLPSGPVFVCRNACKDSPMTSSSTGTANDHKNVHAPGHHLQVQHHKVRRSDENKKHSKREKLKIKPSRPSCIYQGKATPLGRSRRIPGDLTCTCIKQKSGSLVFSCTKEEGNRVSEERRSRKKKEELLRYLRNNHMSHQEDTVTKHYHHAHNRHDESITEIERKRKKREQVLEFMRHQVLLRNKSQMTKNLRKASEIKHGNGKRSKAKNSSTNRSQLQWRMVKNHHRPIPKSKHYHQRHNKQKKVESVNTSK